MKLNRSVHQYIQLKTEQAMVSSSFHKVCNLKVLHEYYKDGICKELSYVPSNTTQKLIDKFSFKLMIASSGFDWYVASRAGLEELLNYITKTTGIESFDFDVTTSNSSFYQFTNLPVNEIGILYFSNKSVERALESEVIELAPFFIEKPTASTLFRVSIKFKNLLEKYKEGQMVNYQIMFKARKTLWKYYILNTTKQNLGHLSIESNNIIEFEGPKEVLLPNKEKAQLFNLVKPLLPFSEVPEYNFNLISTTKKSGVNRAKLLFKGLPNPNPNSIEINNISVESIVSSPMYVYV